MSYKICMNFVKTLKFLWIFEVIVKKIHINYKIYSDSQNWVRERDICIHKAIAQAWVKKKQKCGYKSCSMWGTPRFDKNLKQNAITVQKLMNLKVCNLMTQFWPIFLKSL
jgi:hypothetical protein